MSPAVVRGCNGPKALLSRSVPNLQLDDLAFQFNGPDFLSRAYEVDADGGNEAFSVGVVCEAEEEAGFPYA